MATPYRLRMPAVVMLVISLVIGMGIFRTPSIVAARTGSQDLFYLAWILGGIVALCGALSFAEVGRRMPVNGAYFRMFSAAYHPIVACAINILILVSNAASAAGVALIGAEYSAPFFPGVPATVLATAMIALLYALNRAGLRASATTQNVLMSFKLLMLAAIILAPLWIPIGLVGSTAPTVSGTSGSPLALLGMALIPVAFTFGGYQSTINLGGDVHNAQRTVPRSIILGVVLITTLYLLANYAYVSVLGFAELARTETVAAAVMSRVYGDTGSWLFSALMVISVFGYINVTMLANPRVLQAMAEDGVVPRSLYPGSGPEGLQPSLLAFTIVSVLCVFGGESFERILNCTIFVDAIGLAMGAATVFFAGSPTSRLHARLAASVFITSCLYTTVSLVIFDLQSAAIGLAVFAGITILSAVSIRRNATQQ
jgi:basic amino acid/polyamine antiporter, APA family